MRASFWIISTGTELAQGRSRDTNAPEIAHRLADLGFDVAGISVLPDDPVVLESYLRWILSTSGVSAVLMTGGLGPTQDDYTIDVLAKVTGSFIVEDPTALKRLEVFAARRGRIVLASARRQVRILEQSEPIPNRTGLAPGLLIGLPSVRPEKKIWLAALPGVPSEMRPMLETTLERLRPHMASAGVFRTEFHVYEEAESEFQRLFFGDGPAGSLTKAGTDSTTEAPDLPPGAALCQDPAFRWGVAAIPGSIKVFLEHERAGEEIIALRDRIALHYRERFLEQPVEDLLPALLQERGWTLSLAESCTGGLISKLLTDRAGSSAYFQGGAVVYSNQAKTDLLGVPESLIKEKGAVSEECALAMAEGARRVFRTDFALSITGIAGPDGGTQEKPVGTVYIAGQSNRKGFSRRLFYPLDRERVREYTARAALFRLYDFIRKEQPPGDGGLS